MTVLCAQQSLPSPSLDPVYNIAIVMIMGLSRLQQAAGHTVSPLMSHIMQISAAPDVSHLPPRLPAPAVPRVSAAPALAVTLQVPT
mgnify:CR=1 FL=1